MYNKWDRRPTDVTWGLTSACILYFSIEFFQNFHFTLPRLRFGICHCSNVFRKMLSNFTKERDVLIY